MSLDGESIIIMAFEPLSTSQRRGVLVVAVFSLLSALALAFIALRTIRLAMMLYHKRDDSTSRPPEILFFRTQLGHYAGCLILSNMFISAAGLIDFRWVSRSGLSQGSTCSAQAALMQIGIWGTCWFTAAHGVHTLSSLGFHIRPARWRSSVCVAFGWTIAFVAGLAPLWRSDVYGPTGTSCSITPSYPKEIFALEALPIILGASVSTVLYFIIFIVLHGKLGANSTLKLRDPKSTSQREDSFEEYFKFIGLVVRTMFWFPLAFVLLLLPFCITYILVYAGYPVSSASSVFADACVSMLGLVNVLLLRNTFRVIGPMYHDPRAPNIATETVRTFGHDASGESPIVPQPTFCSQSAAPSHESNYTQSSSTRLSSSSWAGVYPNTELSSAEKASHESIRTNMAPPVLSGVMPPAKLNRCSRVISPQISTKRQDIAFQSQRIDDPSSRTASFGRYLPRVPSVTGDTRDQPSTQDEESTFHPMTYTNDLGKSAKEPTFKSEALLSVNNPRSSIHRPGTVSWSPENADEQSSRHYSFASTMTVSTDSDSDYAGEIVHVYKVRPLPQIPGESNHEQDTTGSYPLDPRRLRGRSYLTLSTVWSQESGSTMGHSPDAESQEPYWKMAGGMVVPVTKVGDGADVGDVMRRQATPPRPYSHSETLPVSRSRSYRISGPRSRT